MAKPKPQPRASSRQTPTSDRRRWLLALALGVATVAAYAPAFRGDFVWDDDAYVSENAALTSTDGLRRIWLEPGTVPQYYPVTFTSFWLEHQFWGNRPAGYHVVNVALHIAGALVLWWVFRILQFPAAWLLAALFALHPLHVESVAWITERKNVLSGLFYLLSAGVYLRGVALADEPPAAGRRLRYAASLLLFMLALSSKTVTATLPAALLLAIWWRRGRIEARDVVPLIPFFLAGLGFGLVTPMLEREHVGAAGAEWDLSWIDRGLVAGRAVWFYAGKLALPHPLVFIYPRWQIDAAAAWQYLFPLAAVLVVAVLFVLRRRIGRGPVCAVLFFGGTLFPALGFFDVYPMRFSFVADHFCYLASIGPLALAAAGLSAVPRLSPPARSALIAVILAACVWLTWERSHAYRSREVLWRDTLASNPGAWIAHNNLGAELLARGQADAATVELREALRLNPGLDDAHNNLGVIATSQGRTEEAIAHFEEAVRITPGFGAALLNLAAALHARGRVAEAIPRYEQALATRSRDRRVQQSLPALHANLGMALESSGRTAEAVPHYREALRLNPQLAVVRQRLAALDTR